MIASSNDRQISRYNKTVSKINELELGIKKLQDQQIFKRIAKIKEDIHANTLSLKDALPEVFALTREASVRTLGMRPFDVQILGGIALHHGFVTEMKTGEGKTLVATCPVVLNALSGKGVHVVTVNDYLAERDANWMRPLYEFLGLSVGIVVNTSDDEERHKSYQADITYATNNELGFDYLRDNMKSQMEHIVQRDYHFAVIDEVDNILIDEARTPLIISGPAEESSSLYVTVQTLVVQLRPSDYEVDKKIHTTTLTEQGNLTIEKLIKDKGLINQDSSLFDMANIKYLHYINQALRANTLYQKDKDYIVRDDQVIIIDEFTGRMSEGRRFSEGLHQALEAKEKVKVQLENQTLASITYQNYFRLYNKLSGMTGTAETDAAELSEIYSLDVIVLPTNKPMIREDFSDSLFATSEHKYKAVMKFLIKTCAKQQPILIGTTSIEESEVVSHLLNKNNIPHQVLNAKQHEREADIIAQAGLPGNVTIATNMAGRGTDIILGGNKDKILQSRIKEDMTPQQINLLRSEVEGEFTCNQSTVLQAGGLLVLGMGRNESRRVDNQLRGRAGRQGDPGMSKFFLSLDDDLLKIFLPEGMRHKFQKLDDSEDGDISNPLLNRAVVGAQKRMEGRNFDIRKQLLRYDDVMNSQRKEIYAKRSEVMSATNLIDEVSEMFSDTVDSIIENSFVNDKLDKTLLKEELHRIFNLNVNIEHWLNDVSISTSGVIQKVEKEIFEYYQDKRNKWGKDLACKIECLIYLQTLDQLWKEHLLAMDHLRQGIHLRAYGQRDPLNEYKSEAFTIFTALVVRIRETFTHGLMVVNPDISFHDVDEYETQEEDDDENYFTNNIDENYQGVNAVNSTNNTGRNDPCVCGSNKKLKHCCGRK